LPTLKGLLIHMWERGWQYVKKAGTIILLVTIILWAMSTFPRDAARQQRYDADVAQAQADYGEQLTDDQQAELDDKLLALERDKMAHDVQYSVVGRLGRGIEPAVRPMGFDWRISTGLMGALAAKEVFVSQLGVVYALGEADQDAQALQARLQHDYTPLVGFCVMLFTLITAPCIATVAVTRQESGSWRWALGQLFGLTALAYVITTVVYQVGRLFT